MPQACVVRQAIDVRGNILGNVTGRPESGRVKLTRLGLRPDTLPIATHVHCKFAKTYFLDKFPVTIVARTLRVREDSRINDPTNCNWGPRSSRTRSVRATLAAATGGAVCLVSLVVATDL